MKKFFIALGLVVVALILVLRFGYQPEAFAADSASAARLAPGPHPVATLDHTFVDPSRPTRALGEYAGADERTMVGRVWYPANETDKPYPIIVYSHGFSSTFEGGAYLAQHLASWGHVVVAVSYPLTNFEAPGGPDPRDVMNQPADVSFLIDALIAFGSESGHVLRGKVDSERIGVTGLSLGGMTTTLVAYHPELRDPRVDAALSIAGPTFAFTERFFQFAQLPFLMLAGDIDALVPYGSNAAPVPELIPGGELVTVTGASHSGFAGPTANIRWMDNPDALGCWMVSRNIGDSMDEPWYDRIGSPEQGVNHDAESELCLMDPLPPAMNVLRQQMITAVVVTSFFQRELSNDAPVRAAAGEYLQSTMAQELAEVAYR